MEVKVHSILSRSGDVFVLNLTSEEVFTNPVLADILNEIANNLRGVNVPQDINGANSGLNNGIRNDEDSITEDFIEAIPDIIRDANETGD